MEKNPCAKTTVLFSESTPTNSMKCMPYLQNVRMQVRSGTAKFMEAVLPAPNRWCHDGADTETPTKTKVVYWFHGATTPRPMGRSSLFLHREPTPRPIFGSLRFVLGTGQLEKENKETRTCSSEQCCLEGRFRPTGGRRLAADPSTKRRASVDAARPCHTSRSNQPCLSTLISNRGRRSAYRRARAAPSRPCS